MRRQIINFLKLIFGIEVPQETIEVPNILTSKESYDPYYPESEKPKKIVKKATIKKKPKPMAVYKKRKKLAAHKTRGVA